MNISALDRTSLRVLADAIGRIDYADADMEAAREGIRDAVAAAIAAQDTPAPPSSDAAAVRYITMEDLGPQAQAAARHAIAIGADRVTVSTMGPVYWRGAEQLEPAPAPRAS